jgi:hypothetical protein
VIPLGAPKDGQRMGQSIVDQEAEVRLDVMPDAFGKLLKP